MRQGKKLMAIHKTMIIFLCQETFLWLAFQHSHSHTSIGLVCFGHSSVIGYSPDLTRLLVTAGFEDILRKWRQFMTQCFPTEGGIYLWCFQGDLDTHGSSDTWKLASQCLLGFMSHLWDVFDGQIKLEEMKKTQFLLIIEGRYTLQQNRDRLRCKKTDPLNIESP